MSGEAFEKGKSSRTVLWLSAVPANGLYLSQGTPLRQWHCITYSIIRMRNGCNWLPCFVFRHGIKVAIAMW